MAEVEELKRQIEEMNPDIIVCIGWPRLIKEPILSLLQTGSRQTKKLQ